MRATIRMLASVKPARYLEAGNPTGLTGLLTHPAPRSALIYLYSSTLDKLKAFPESSVYRQSVEALTRHRLKVVESFKPEGYDAWAKRAQENIDANPKAFATSSGSRKSIHDGRSFVTTQYSFEDPDDREEEWNGEEMRTIREGPRVQDPSPDFRDLNEEMSRRDMRGVEWEPEPPLEAAQVSEIENQIGAGLIEEVIQVAEGELRLVGTMVEAKVWEALEEKAPQGQWDYFARDQHTPGTQEPPNR